MEDIVDLLKQELDTQRVKYGDVKVRVLISDGGGMFLRVTVFVEGTSHNTEWQVTNHASNHASWAAREIRRLVERK